MGRDVELNVVVKVNMVESPVDVEQHSPMMIARVHIQGKYSFGEATTRFLLLDAGWKWTLSSGMPMFPSTASTVPDHRPRLRVSLEPSIYTASLLK